MHSYSLLAEELALWTTTNCQPFEASFASHVLSVTRYLSIFTTLSLYIAGIRYCEVYLLLFGLGATLNWATNIAVRAAVGDLTFVVPTCVDAYALSGNWPSYQSQEAAFIVTFLFTYCLIYRARFHIASAFLLTLFFTSVVAADKLLNYHTTSQIVGGVVIGSVLAVLYQIVLRLFVLPLSPQLLSFRIARYLEYRETLCTKSATE